jgi:hypothetical protein
MTCGFHEFAASRSVTTTFALRVYESSAENGDPIHMVEIPVTLVA